MSDIIAVELTDWTGRGRKPYRFSSNLNILCVI